MNPGIKPDAVEPGQTILLPAGTLSRRDREILEGIGQVYRIYPVRKGEALNDIISKRNITRDEMKQLNPGVNIDKLKGEQFGSGCSGVPQTQQQQLNRPVYLVYQLVC